MKDKKKKDNQELVLTDIYTNDNDVEISKEERIETIVKEKNKKKINVKKTNNKKNGLSFKLKTFFFGLGKEFERMSWTNKSDLVKNFIVVICIVVILTAIFTGVGIGMQKLLSL